MVSSWSYNNNNNITIHYPYSFVRLYTVMLAAMAIGSPASIVVAGATTTLKKNATAAAATKGMTMSTTTCMTTPAATPRHHPRAAVVGGSLGGLAAANALLSAGWTHVDVYERAPGPLHDKGSGLGYVNVPAWEALRRRRRRHHNPNHNYDAPMMMRRGQRASRHQGSFFYGDLWKYLYEGLPENTVKFGRTVESLTINDPDPAGAEERKQRQQRPTVSIGDEKYDLVVVANGGFSTLRRYVLGVDPSPSSSCRLSSTATATTTTTATTSIRNSLEYQREPEYAGYVVWRGGIPTSLLSRTVLTQLQEGVYKNGLHDTILLRQAKDNGEDLWTMGTFIETPEDDVHQYWNKTTDGASRHGTTTTHSNNKKKMPEWLLKHFRQYFAHVPGLVELMEAMKEYGEVTPHPQYEFGYIERVHHGRIVLLGDAAHMASPRTAVGAHTAILDALGLMEAFSDVTTHQAPPKDDSHDSGDILSLNMDMIDVALQRYSQYGGISRAHELYARSRQVSSEFVGHG